MEWLNRVNAALKGTNFEEKLVSHTRDGIRINPLYGRIAGPRAERGVVVPWIVQARVDHPDAVKANAQALDDLANGAAGLTLVCNGHSSARGFGLDAGDLGRALQGVPLHAIALRIEGGLDASLAFAGYVSTQPIDPARLSVCFAESDAALLAAQGYSGPFFEADGRKLHEQGGTEAQELGAVLATAASLLQTAAPSCIGVTLAANQDMFLMLAKFRAMRWLWRRVLEASGMEDAPLRLHAETSWRMMARLDPHSNILRSCAAVFGAGLGGADSISVLPFSQAQGLPNSFARRTARNVQAVLLEEAQLWRVADPASGAGYVEQLTRELCEVAWVVFQRAMRGEWPVPDAANASSLPVIGTVMHRLAAETAAEIEVLP